MSGCPGEGPEVGGGHGEQAAASVPYRGTMAADCYFSPPSDYDSSLVAFSQPSRPSRRKLLPHRRKSVLRLRTPLVPRRGQRLSVCSVARFSTEEQRRQSIQAQHRYDRSALEGAGITDYEWEEVSDEGVSGELKDRPGIERLREGIAKREWDLIICEDSSRLYRSIEFCLALVGLAVDHRIRVICIGDGVDTAEDDWRDRLVEAQQHHCRDNKFTRHRIKRSIEDLWEMGAAVGKLRPGLKRRPTKEATENNPAEGPFYDEVDPNWRTVFYEAFERIARGEPTWFVAIWLTEVGLPKSAGRIGKWSASNVVSLIQCTVYRGLELHGKTKNVMKNGSGKSEAEDSEPDEIKQREMPHHRIVPDALWYQANEAIKARTRGGNHDRGDEHPLANIPRDSRFPLSRLFACFCGCKMNREGRNEG